MNQKVYDFVKENDLFKEVVSFQTYCEGTFDYACSAYIKKSEEVRLVCFSVAASILPSKMTIQDLLNVEGITIHGVNHYDFGINGVKVC